jgi:hypothetical protein
MSACLKDICASGGIEEAMYLGLALMVAMMCGHCYKLLSTFLFMNYMCAICVFSITNINYPLCAIC